MSGQADHDIGTAQPNADQMAKPDAPRISADLPAISVVTTDPVQPPLILAADQQIHPATPATAVSPSPAKRRKSRRHRTGIIGRLMFVALVFGLIFAAFALTGKSIGLPLWAVVEIEDRLNASLSQTLPEGALAIGAVNVMVDKDWVPRLHIEDIRLLKQGGEALLSLPEMHLTLDPAAVLQGQLRVRSLRLIGAKLVVIRDKDGLFDLSLGAGRLDPPITSLAQVFDAADTFFATPAASSLQKIEAEGLSITLQDQRAGRTWEAGDGRLAVYNRDTELAAELGLSLVGGGLSTPHAVISVVSQKGSDTARLTAQIDGIAAKDIASQVAPLAWAGIVDAPISGRIATTLDASGIAGMEAKLTFASGALQPNPEARPILFDAAAMALRYDPGLGRINLTDFSVQSPSLRVTATGHSYLTRADGTAIIGTLGVELPAAFVTQFQFSQVVVDPEGLFQEPVVFSAGALDLRLRLDPFSVEIGQLALAEDKRRLTAKGKISADTNGWHAAIDMALNEVTHDRLLALWPFGLLPNTRAWLGKNVSDGALTNVQAALRIEPGTDPLLQLGYNFANAEVRFLATLPPIKAGYGYASVTGKTYMMVLSRGKVTPPEGGEIDMAGSVFAVPDITRKPARAEITLQTFSSLTAALSLLDLPPFNFMQKADRPVALGDGAARIKTELRMPLQKKVSLADVQYDVTGTVGDFSSDVVVPGRMITADLLQVSATPKGLAISGPGLIGDVPFDVTYSQQFGPDQKGVARIEGSVSLSQRTAEEFGLGLPAGLVTGQGAGQVVIELAKGAPGRLKLVSDLNRIGLSIPELGWSKPAAARGRLEAVVQLGKTPKVENLTLTAPGLNASGSVTMRAGGGLDIARFDKVQLDDWLDAAVEIQGRGKGKPVGLALTGGSVDLRRMPGADRRKGSGKSGSPLDVRLDELRVSNSIAFTGFRGKFSLAGGLNGRFTAGINGKSAVQGTVIPSKYGSAVRLLSDNAGATLAAANVFSSARNGTLDLALTPRPAAGQYDGLVTLKNIRVRNTSILADLLNAISVIGILEQLQGGGLVFSDAEGEFLLTPGAVELRRGSAIGASLGISMAGVYESGTGQLKMQGVISPIYLLNGIGAVFTRRGEGLFGFNYTLRGTSSDPTIGVNPLSIITPGMFRDIFRSPAPVLKDSGG